jgi:multiple antibiotic resistance protein
MPMVQQLFSYAMGTFWALFPIANPLGAVPVFYSLTAEDSDRYRKVQATRVVLNVIWVLIAFLITGRLILEFFGISLGVLRIAGGLLIGHTAWEMVTARQRLTDLEQRAALDRQDVSFVPMAVPLVSGPGAIGVVIGFSDRANHWLDYLGCILGILLLGGLLYLCLTLGNPLIKALGKNELGAMNRVLGFFILAIAVQFIADGVLAWIKESAPGLLR